MVNEVFLLFSSNCNTDPDTFVALNSVSEGLYFPLRNGFFIPLIEKTNYLINMVNLKNLNLNFCTFFFFYKVKVSIGTSVTLKLEQGTSGDHEKLLFKIPKLKVITVNTTGIFCHYRAFLCVTSVR